MIRSMTAFASRRTPREGGEWEWEIRGVNGRGLDLRLRLPEGVEGLEAGARAALSARLQRGSVSLSLRAAKGAREPFGLDEGQLDRVLRALNHVQERAYLLGVTLAQATAADVLAQRGVVAQAEAAADEGLAGALLADLDLLLADFVAAREAEGRALHAVLHGQVDAVAALVAEAAAAAERRAPEARAGLRASLARLGAEVDEARLLQELALLAVRADVTEELDRLGAHVASARALLDEGGAVGRRLDFLTQELNREANTLCAKSGHAELTRIGLALKALIDQMREQAANVE